MFRRAIDYRINRSTYWVSLLIVVGMIAVILWRGWEIPSLGIVSVIVLAMLAALRLHDIGKTAKIALWGALIHSALQVAALVVFGVDRGLEAAGVLNLVLFGLLAWLGSIPGEASENRWGHPPAEGVAWRRPDRS